MAGSVYGYNDYGYAPYNPNLVNGQSRNVNFTPGFRTDGINSYNRGMGNYASSSSNYSVAYVNNEQEAYAYPVAPGNTLILMDLNNSKFYMKASDFNGNPQTMRIFEYNEVIPQQLEDKHEGQVSREEFESLKKMVEELMK